MDLPTLCLRAEGLFCGLNGLEGGTGRIWLDLPRWVDGRAYGPLDGGYCSEQVGFGLIWFD